MKVVTSTEAMRHQNSATCTAYEYEFKDEKSINGAVIELTGRYPDSGQVLNDVCKELAYIVDGSGVLTQAGQTYSLNQGDMALIQPGEPYYFDGTLKMLISSSPAWYPEQHHNVE
jgi:mannose-6-phosphate isomerase-like protein (cupin superfamily)